MFKAFGAAPASINFNEVYSALQTKIVEGQENPLSIISIAKLYEVQKYFSITNHMWDGFWILANGQAWAKLPKDLQGIVERNFNAAALKDREDIRQLNESLQGDLQAKGMVFNKTDAEPFRAALRKAGFYAEWKEKYGAEAWGAAGEGGRRARLNAGAPVGPTPSVAAQGGGESWRGRISPSEGEGRRGRHGRAAIANLRDLAAARPSACALDRDPGRRAGGDRDHGAARRRGLALRLQPAADLVGRACLDPVPLARHAGCGDRAAPRTSTCGSPRSSAYAGPALAALARHLGRDDRGRSS